MKFSVKNDDYVMIIAGKDKGKTAHVKSLDRINHRALIEGDALKTRNIKAVKARRASDKGGRIEQPGTIDVSNLMPICSQCEKPTRVGYRIDEEGDKVRVCKKCGSTLEASKSTARKMDRKARIAAKKKEKEKRAENAANKEE
ncbi:MAG: 50S ribosomal protein L24 [Christensenellaceae bacterium]|jgi:large subunit ribosomal protein L24|nr:50S ribosomal protein L24 [Christensenellaceae bacterium]